MKPAAVILVFIIIAMLEIPGLLKKKQLGELTVFIVLLAIGFMLSYLQVNGVKVPNPNKGIEHLIKWLQGR